MELRAVNSKKTTKTQLFMAQSLDLDTGELSSTVSGEENVFPDLEDILAQLPDVPSVPPDEPKDGATCATANVTAMSSIPCAASGGPTFSEDTDKPAEVQLLWPLEEVFAIQDGSIFYRWVARVRSWWSGVRYEQVFPIYGGPFQKDIHYEYLGSVGSGWSGVVCQKAGTIRGPKLTFVTKPCPTYNRDEILALQMGRERGNPQTAGYLGAIPQGRSAVIFTELMAGGTLKEFVESRKENGKGPVLEKTCCAFAKDIFQAKKFLHEKVGMVHNDIHEGNVLLNADHTFLSYKAGRLRIGKSH